MTIREELEHQEHRLLNPLAAFSDKSEGRPMKEGYATTVLHSDKGDRFYGPGHCGEIFKGQDKKEYIFYHCHVEGSRNRNSRPFFIAQIKWDKAGWPYVEGGKPQ